jgi:hypothetical protein
MGALEPGGKQAANRGLYMAPNASAYDPEQTRTRVGALESRDEQAANRGLYMTPSPSVHDPKQTRVRAGACKPGGEQERAGVWRERAYVNWGAVRVRPCEPGGRAGGEQMHANLEASRRTSR